MALGTLALALLALLRVDKMDVSYRSFWGSKEALKDVSCTVNAGITLVVGLSEAGKSTLLKAVTGRLEISAGSATLAEDAAMRIVDSEVLKSRRSFRELLDYGGSLETAAIVGTLEDTTPEMLDAPMRDLSRSMAAYMGVAAACLGAICDEGEGRILVVLDEFTDKEDVRVSDRFWRRVQRLVGLASGRVGVLAVTHQVATAKRYADSTIFLARGSLLQECPPEDLLFDGTKLT